MSTLPAPTQSVEVKNAETPLGPPGDRPQSATPEVTPPAGYAPIVALQGEQANTKAAREQATLYRTTLEMHGFTVGQDGTITPPQPAQTPQQAQQPIYQPAPPMQGQFGPQTQALADRLGVRPEELTAVVQEAAGPI